MALDLANGYIRKDSASASNVYYGTVITQQLVMVIKFMQLER